MSLETEIEQSIGCMTEFPLLWPNIKIQILLTDLHIFCYSIGWENLLKDQSNFPLIILSILITFSLD